MRLTGGGRDFVWGKGEEGCIDDEILAIQREYSKNGLSIWGTEGCNRCGACCYMPQKWDSPEYTKCRHLITEGGTAACGIHGKDKPQECTNWGCYDRINPGTPGQRYHMIRIAVDILKTKTENDIIN